MPPVALLLEELVAAINAPTAQAALGLSCPAHRGYLETQTLPAQQDRAAWLSPQQWRPIGRAGGLALEQHVVHLQLVRKLESDQPPAIDVELDLAGKLRTLLQDFEGSNSRGRGSGQNVAWDRSRSTKSASRIPARCRSICCSIATF
jgi:hypothetical protein